ncbi:MAG: tRNA (adenosine(37)-N6)-threonylcarbamoyltransferase complex ATPase subunit type 1 TsaE [Kiloniellales bacterium]|nr:tRNA (adenosine(37)-N6)-threonylcarbamoyltransferase complex ATPase subunit type 1 TsaE [Kiloniellales bacterium]
MAVALRTPPKRQLRLDDRAATEALARRVAPLLRAGDLVALWGDLGSGKTSFARALIGALPAADPAAEPEEVPSPTFTLVQIYDRRPAPVWHFDLYRIRDPEEVLELGFEQALAEAVSLVEWPERLGALLPEDRLDLRLDFGPAPEARVARLEGHGAWAARLADLELDGEPWT